MVDPHAGDLALEQCTRQSGGAGIKEILIGTLFLFLSTLFTLRFFKIVIKKYRNGDEVIRYVWFRPPVLGILFFILGTYYLREGLIYTS